MTSPQEDDAKVSMLVALSLSPPLSNRIQLSEAWKFRGAAGDAQNHPVDAHGATSGSTKLQKNTNVPRPSDFATAATQIVRTEDRGIRSTFLPVVSYYPCSKQFYRLSITVAHTRPIARDTTRLWNNVLVSHKSANAKRTQENRVPNQRYFTRLRKERNPCRTDAKALSPELSDESLHHAA
jgi:hypothetical protein